MTSFEKLLKNFEDMLKVADAETLIKLQLAFSGETSRKYTKMIHNPISRKT